MKSIISKSQGKRLAFMNENFTAWKCQDLTTGNQNVESDMNIRLEMNPGGGQQCTAG
jgi:hypothetical protein